MRRNPEQRIVVVGTTGSGKTTLARRLAERLDLPHVELDALNWEPGWVPAPREVFRERVRQAVEPEGWVVDGNYSAVRDILWRAADTVVWLDFALPVILRRLLGRTLRRGITGQELWNGNRERLWQQFLTRDSILLWALRTYRRRRREVPALVKQQEYAHLTMIRLRSPGEAEEWLAAVTGAPRAGTVTPGRGH